MQTDRIIYFGDPMCSWCWGLTEHLDQLIQNYQGTLDFQMVMGGLRPGGGDEWNDEYKDMLRQHWDHVAEASDQPFNHALFDRDQFDYDTEPPSRAVRVVRDLRPENEWLFYQSVQRKFYAENEDPGTLEFYLPLCETNKVDPDTFTNSFESEEYKQLTRMDFMFAQKLGMRSFPSVVLQVKEQLSAVAIGFSSFEKMKSTIDKMLESR